ncbi:hypothetical protein KNE206_67060 [Kitasatospora sp. NE20-6]|uniref:hypothetical protein n=1 Tax=Kitasatospora sp. NE20-6 TaxID=2859066 RepID=UPI0034DC7209
MTRRRPTAVTAAHRTRAAACLALAAAVLAAWSGYGWYAAAHDDSAAFARTRDQVLAAGEQAVQNMNTLDAADLDRGLALWESSTTGTLHDQLVQGRAAFAAQVQQAKTVTSAQVLSGAVTELDDRAGRATVMVAVRITVRTPQAATPAASTKDSRLLGELTRTGETWKLSALGQAPMGTTADTPAPTATTSGPPASATPGH